MTSPPDAADLCYRDARELARMIRRREVSSEEVVGGFLDRIEKLDPSVNAIPTLRPREELLAEARAADAAVARGDELGRLHGLPHAVKDTAQTQGIRTTMGSPILSDNVPDADEIFVERLRAAGAILIGKTNVPEFGAGSHTFNPVFGVTRNPWDTSRSCGGSSGGAAVALACGMVPLADGSDMGGSLRNPGSFNNVVGFRPSFGRVPRSMLHAWEPLTVNGPLGRTVGEAAYLLSVMAGPDARDPVCLDEPGASFAEPLACDPRGLKIGWSRDLGLPVAPEVAKALLPARSTLESLGCDVQDEAPDFGGAGEIFQTLRAWTFAGMLGGLLEPLRDELKDTLVWNIERGLALTGQDVAAAERARTKLYEEVTRFFERFDFLCLPTSQVAPFPVETEWVREIDGVAMETYIDWMQSCSLITLTGLPAVSVPAGFTDGGLPVGLQIVGRRHADRRVLELAHAFEQATGHGRRRPPLAAEA